MTHLPENRSVEPSVTQQRITCSRPSYGDHRPESSFLYFFFFILIIFKN